jgi:hypothetical protein
MTDEVIDGAIFSALSEIPWRWRKVAMVISKVTATMSDGLAFGGADYETVARRIEFLVSEGRLLSRGDIKNWRFSEVRLPD